MRFRRVASGKVAVSSLTSCKFHSFVNPFPIADFRHVLAVLIDVLTMTKTFSFSRFFNLMPASELDTKDSTRLTENSCSFCKVYS